MHKVIIQSYPDHKVSAALLFWLLDNGFERKDFIFTRTGGRDVCTAYNAGIKLALDSGADDIVFADNDIFPDARTAPFLEANYADILCCEYNGGCGCTWKDPQDFHTALWRTNRHVLELIGLPAFRWPQTADGSTLTACPCSYFSARAKKLGVTFAHVGTVQHSPRAKDGLTDVIQLQ